MLLSTSTLDRLAVAASFNACRISENLFPDRHFRRFNVNDDYNIRSLSLR